MNNRLVPAGEERDGATPEAGAGRSVGEAARDDIFFAAVGTTPMPMVVTDPHQPDNPIVFCNAAFTNLTGYSLDEIRDCNCRFLQGPDTDRSVIAEIRDAVEQGKQRLAKLVESGQALELVAHTR